VTTGQLADDLRSERDRLQTRLDQQERARQGSERERQAERERLIAERELARQQALNATRRGDALDAQLGPLRDELDRLRQDCEAEQEKAASAEKARADEQWRLAQTLIEQRAAVARAEKAEAELRSLREARVPTAGTPPVGVGTAGTISQVSPGAAAGPTSHVEELTRQLRLAQETNERLRSFLAVFGPHDQSIANDAR
jgi:hypothetical protein